MYFLICHKCLGGKWGGGGEAELFLRDVRGLCSIIAYQHRKIQRGVVFFGLGGGYHGRAGAAGGAACCVLAQSRQARSEQAGYYRLPVLFLLR